MSKISVMMPVYNEGDFLHDSLSPILPHIDELVIIDGSPYGPSTDTTREIIEHFSRTYPGKVKADRGTFAIDEGENLPTWDESAHRNLLLSRCTGDFVIPHCGDMIYTERDFAHFTNAIRAFPDTKVFYCYFIEFWLSEQYIRLYRGHIHENWFPVPAIGDTPVIRRDIMDCYHDGPFLTLRENIPAKTGDMVFVHEAKRYHYGWIRGFKRQIERHFRNVKLGGWDAFGEELRAKGDKAIWQWAVAHVINYPKEGILYPYFGTKPLAHRNWRYNTGLGEAIAELNKQYGGDICTPEAIIEAKATPEALLRY